jgi:hypothetical protein
MATLGTSSVSKMTIRREKHALTHVTLDFFSGRRTYKVRKLQRQSTKGQRTGRPREKGKKDWQRRKHRGKARTRKLEREELGRQAD